jgi:phosphoribosylamine--glycine ligase
MNVLLLGSGGREHALAWKISQSELLNRLYIAPGNAGTEMVGENVALDNLNFEAVGQFCLKFSIDLLVVGPEEPLVKGITDFFLSNDSLKHIAVIGPSMAGAMLEGSKDFAKAFMKKYGIPTADYETFTNENAGDASDFIDKGKAPYVIKADGLAAGKGVLIIDHAEAAKQAVNDMLKGKFGDAGKKVVIESFLTGIEVSVFILTDGKSYILLPEAKDYKRIGDGDTGLNTGGMGAVSPVPFMSPELMMKIENEIIRPTLHGLQEEGIRYKGFIFFGLMISEKQAYVIEYNCRMGDPETEVVMPRLENDLLELFKAVNDNTLENYTAHVDEDFATTVMVVSGGYPEDYEKGREITGLNEDFEGLVFHAGTRRDDNDAVITNGGRVMAFTGMGTTLQEALKVSYNDIKKICYDGIYFRKDIGKDII